MWSRVLFVVACLLIPILWGAAVNWLFNFWNERANGNDNADETIFPDYQI